MSRSRGRTSWRWASTCCRAPSADALRERRHAGRRLDRAAPAEWEAVKDHCDNLIFEGFAA